MEIPFIYSDLQQAPSWGCRSWYPKACLAAWRWGFYPSLPTNLLFTLGLLLCLSELKFPICEANVTSHRFGNRSQKGWAGFKEPTNLDLLNGSPNVLVLLLCELQMWCWLEKALRSFIIYPLTPFFFFCYPTSIYWPQDFLSEATGETKSHSQLDLLQIY